MIERSVLSKVRVLVLSSVVGVSVSAAMAAPWEPKTTKARTYLDEGRKAFAAGDFRRAGALFGQSYDTEANLNAQWNAAQSFAAAGDWKRAGTLYEALLGDSALPADRRAKAERRRALAVRFLAAQAAQDRGEWDAARAILDGIVKDAEVTDLDRASAHAKLAAIATAQTEAGPAVTPLPPPVHDEPKATSDVAPHPAPPRLVQPSRSADRLALGLIGAGALGMGVGTWLVLRANGLDDDGNAATNDGDAQRLHDRATTSRTIGGIALGVGGAVLIAGVIKYIIPPSPRLLGDASLTSVTPIDGGAIVTIGGALP